ncbi:alveolar macrophage chemotactic factor-like [Lissotriton helveticus]
MLAKLIVGVLAVVLIEGQKEYAEPEKKVSFGESIAAERLRCQCVKTESNFIRPRQIRTVEVIPSGTYCAQQEVILVLKSGKEVCVDPNAPWVKKILERILQRSNYFTGS